MKKGLIQKISQVHPDVKKQAERRQKVVRLFFMNPYMQQEVKSFRLKYGMPKDGFNMFDPKNGARAGELFESWHTRVHQKYPVPWEQPPPELIKAQKDWLKLSTKEQEASIEPIELWQGSCYINLKPFQEDLRYIYNRFNKKIPLNDLGAFEWYAVHNRILYPIMNAGSEEPTVVDKSSSRQEVLSEEKDGTGKVLKQISRVYPPYERITEGTPTLLVETETHKVMSLKLELKPNSSRENVNMIWHIVEKYQHKMEGYSSRVRGRDNLMRDATLLRMTKFEGKTYRQAIDIWNELHKNEFIQTEEAAIQHAVDRLDNIFKP
jgi:hypothetical protein